MSEELINLLISASDSKKRTRKARSDKNTKRSEEARLNMSLAARKRSPERVRQISAMRGKYSCIHITAEERARRKEIFVQRMAGTQSKAGRASMSDPAFRRRFLRGSVAFKKLNDEEFEEKMKEMDIRYKERDEARRKELEERKRKEEESKDSSGV